MMPFGLQGAPAALQRMMDSLIHGAHNFTPVYLDDLVIYSTTWKDHLYHFRTVLLRLRKAGLTAKCKYGIQQCVNLRFTVGGGILKPEVDKLQAIQQLPVSNTKRDVRAFLGITGYCHKFILDFATIAVPLTNLTKKKAPNKVVWTEQCNQARQNLKGILCCSLVLRTPDFHLSLYWRQTHLIMELEQSLAKETIMEMTTLLLITVKNSKC